MEREPEEANRETRLYALPLSLSKGLSVYVPGKDADFQTAFKRYFIETNCEYHG